MSIQNNLDIIINSQSKPELKFSSGQNLVSDKAVSYNFEELLTSKKQELQSSDSTEKMSAENQNEKNSDNGAKTETSEKTKETEKSEKKTETKKSEKDEKSENNEEKVEVRGENLTVSEDNPDLTKNDSVKSSKKLTEKDFSKLSQISGNAEQKAAEASADDQTKGLKPAKKELSSKSTQKDDMLSSKVSDVELKEDSEDFAKVLSQLQNNSEGETEDNSADLNKKGEKLSKADKEVKITVKDERTEKTVDEKADKADKKSEVKPKTEVKVTGDNSATITMEMAEETNSDVLTLDNQTAAGSTSNYQSMFANQLQEAAPDFVKAGQIVLKDNNQGTINLVIHPDDLGNVKIHLALDGKSVSAQITVATKEAMQVFKDNAETLREAFIKQGYENATFDVSYGNNSGLGQNSDFNQQNDGRELYAHKAYGSFIVNEDSGFEENFENNLNSGNYSINIVA